MDINDEITRRKFLAGLITIPALGVVTAPLVAVGQYVYPPSSLTKPPAPKAVAKVGELQVLKGKPFDYNDLKAYLVRVSETEYKSYYLKCTHLGCTVVPPSNDDFTGDKMIICPCHGGKYDINGVNVPGTPPPAPLIELAVEIQGDNIIVKERSA